MNILDIEMDRNDAGAKTIREYLKALLLALWNDGECFSGKRPFGNSGWNSELILPLVMSDAITGKVDSDGYLEDWDDDAADKLIREAIASL